MIVASCNSAHADPELVVVVGVVPTPICADAGSDLLHLMPWPFHLVLGVVVTDCKLQRWCFYLSRWHKYSTCAHDPWFIHCNLHWCGFSLQPLAQILCWQSSNLHCVVVVDNSGYHSASLQHVFLPNRCPIILWIHCVTEDSDTCTVQTFV